MLVDLYNGRKTVVVGVVVDNMPFGVRTYGQRNCTRYGRYAANIYTYYY